MPKKSKKKPWKPKNRVTRHPEVVSDVSTAQHNDIQYRENPVKSDTDPNEYRVIELPNGLVALLISCPTDPSSEKENRTVRTLPKYAEPNNCPRSDESMTSDLQQPRGPAICCLCVNAGSFCDPYQVPGVSRVLGAATFDLGFKNAPRISSECRKVLHGASARVFSTKSEASISYIETMHRVYRDAIERLGHSLESVTISKYQAVNGRQAVLSFEELRSISFTPAKEKEHLFSQFVPRGHPAKTFDKHYLEGLRQIGDGKVYREVQNFRKRHYSAHRMTVVMKAELPLDTLETHAKECFSRIPNNGLPPQVFDPYNFANSVENAKFRRIWRIDSSDCNEMYVKWIVPPSSWLYRTKSLEFLSWLISYGGAGSLLNYLKMKKWATEVHGSVLDEPAWNTSLYSTFCVSVTLTAIGSSENKLHVLDAIYSYINFLRREGPQESIYDDIRTIRNAEFRYQRADLTDATDIQKLAENMHLYPSTDYLAAPFFWYKYDPVSLTTCLNLMTPTKACILVADGNFGKHLDSKLAGFDRDERSTDIPEDWIDRWQTIEPLPSFKLPVRNIFCPDDLRMIDAPTVLREYPVEVYSDSMSEVWYKFDPDIQGPKGLMNFCYVSPLPLESPENVPMLELFAMVLRDLTRDDLYPATVAGLSYWFEPYVFGLGIRVSGFTQKLPLLAQVCAQSITECYHSLTKSLFETKKAALLDEYSKDYSDLSLTRQILDSIVMPGRWMDFEKHASLARLQFERFKYFVKHFFDHIYIKCFVQGNIAEGDAVKDALRVVKVSQCGPLPRNKIPRLRINKIPRGRHCCTVKAFRYNSSNVTIENHYQFDDFSIELGGILRHLVGLCSGSDYEMTAGFSSNAIYKAGPNNYSLGLVDLSPSIINAKKIALVDAAIEEKQQIARHYLKVGTGDLWKYRKDAVIADIRKRVNSLQSECTNNWHDIVNGEYTFGRISAQLDALHEMDSADFHKWIEYITDDSNIRKLSIRIVGDKYSRADFSTVTTQPDEPSTEANNIPLYRLQYLTEQTGRSGNPSYNCITDINEFTKQLEASSNTNITS